VEPLVTYLALTFTVTWTLFLAALALSHAVAPTNQALGLIRGILVFVGTITPGLVAVVITARIGGSTGTKALLDRLFLWRVDARWYLFAIGYMASIKLTVALAYRIMTGTWPRLNYQSLALVLAATIASTPFQAGEEIGWRGYALPYLAERIGLARGSVVLGLIWACWHLPLFFLSVPGNDEYGQSFPVWALGVTGLSVAIAWLYVHTGRSLLLAMLMHSAVNNIPHFVIAPLANARGIFSINTTLLTGLTTLFLCIGAACLFPGMRKLPIIRPEIARPAPRLNRK
jgi:membrane protease YdiL (CAAX protease family)